MTHSTPKKQRTIASSNCLIVVFTWPENILNTLLTIDIQKQIQKVQEVPVSKFSDDLEYIPLELTPTIGQDMKINLTKDYIIVRNYARGVNSLLLLFDRKSGKFIRQIGKIGRGPEEYHGHLTAFIIHTIKRCTLMVIKRSSLNYIALKESFLKHSRHQN